MDPEEERSIRANVSGLCHFRETSFKAKPQHNIIVTKDFQTEFPVVPLKFVPVSRLSEALLILACNSYQEVLTHYRGGPRSRRRSPKGI